MLERLEGLEPLGMLEALGKQAWLAGRGPIVWITERSLDGRRAKRKKINIK